MINKYYAIRGKDKILITEDNASYLTEANGYYTIHESISELEDFVEHATKDELLAYEGDLSELGIQKQKLGLLLSDKFCGGNIYKELELHRVMIMILMAYADLSNITPEHQAILANLGQMNAEVKILLQKFNPG